MKRIEHNDPKWMFPFVEYVPKDCCGQLPLIIQLHGSGERGKGGKELPLVDKLGFSQLLQAGEYPCRVVLPQCPENTFWAARVESLVAFVHQLLQSFPVDENRVYLTGLSMGGFGTWYTAMAAPELFAAIAPVCGGGMDWNAEVLDMPIWVFHGAEDKEVSPLYSDLMVERLRQCGSDVTYTRVDGVAHNVWENAYNEELLLWLLGKHR